MENLAVIDLETAGLSPGENTRATAVSFAAIRDGCISDRYQSLMNSGHAVPKVVEKITGISSEMLASAPPSSLVTHQVNALAKGCVMIAHGARFVRAFWLAELAFAGIEHDAPPFICTLQLARRLYPNLDRYTLDNLAVRLGLATADEHGHALTAADITANLLLHMQQDLLNRYQVDQVSYELLNRLQQPPRIWIEPFTHE